MASLWVLVLFLIVSFEQETKANYTADWTSLDSRPMPQWYKDAKLGIFIHWGLYSVPSMGRLGAEWFWRRVKRPGNDYLRQADKKQWLKDYFPPNFKYQDFASSFKADLWQPDDWANLFKSSGAKYVVLTAKHHDGYVMWPSKHAWNWNSKDTGPGRDLVGELAKSIRKNTQLKFGLYNSLTEWYHPKWDYDNRNGKRTQTFVNEKLQPELRDMVNLYRPSIVWSDGEWGSTAEYWRSLEFLAWLFNESPVKDEVVVNDRWGSDATCEHGSFRTCNDGMKAETLQPFYWESCQSIDTASWGFRRNAVLQNIMTIERLLKTLISTVSYGGNLLLNVGPTSSGIIPPIYEERLRQLGLWMRLNGQGIYGTTPWHRAQNDPVTDTVWYTAKGNLVYAFFVQWPANDQLELGGVLPTDKTRISLVGYSTAPMHWRERQEGGMVVYIPPLTPANLPCQWAWALRMEHVV